ncbi:exocyst complex component sec10 [Diplodia corticola]|uniref:Exocyst complex component sec10 n=1 Tax=Diplodia corticola TaxID=236234 RepID=A0A1J9RYP5_9PEZI|nr:exocyst complex component sec10 [Diplodia corticola]OJD32932.1 exocyst complex component sec10 [Diplodia corticola]
MPPPRSKKRPVQRLRQKLRGLHPRHELVRFVHKLKGLLHAVFVHAHATHDSSTDQKPASATPADAEPDARDARYALHHHRESPLPPPRQTPPGYQSIRCVTPSEHEEGLHDDPPPGVPYQQYFPFRSYEDLRAAEEHRYSIREQQAIEELREARRRASSGLSYQRALGNGCQDFIVKDFIETLSDTAVPVSRRSGNPARQVAFDPKPLIRTFEHALLRLGTLSEDLELQENELAGSVRRAEAQHAQKNESLGIKLEESIEQFNRLDNSLNGGISDSVDSESGGNVAVRIGERLEELDRQRQRAQDAKFLIQCWMEVSERGDLSSLEDVRRLGGGDGKVRCAHIARQLLRLSHRLDPDYGQVNVPRTNGVDGANGQNGAPAKKHNTREIIEKFLEMLEKDLLKQFDDFYRRQNFEGMRECAAALRDFNDGASVMGLFVNQHQFFIDRSQLVTEEVAGDGETWDRLADPDAEPPGVEPSLQSLVDEVRLVVQEESFIIKKAFPYADEVLIRFLQRVFQQSIQARLEMVLDKANSISSLAFLRSLQAARSYIGSLVDDLKSHGLTEHPEPVTSHVAAMLDQQLEDLFIPYLLGSSYIEREKKNLEELYSSLLFKFTVYQSKRRKIATSYLGSLSQRGRELFASAKDAYMERLGSSDISTSQRSMMLQLAGLKEADSDKEIEVSEEDGQLSLPNAKRMLKWLAEGVGRGLELGGGNETPKDVQAMLGLLLSHVGEIYLETALDAAAELATSQENVKNNPPDISYLYSLRTAIGILHLLQMSINTVLLPLAAPSLITRREIEKTTNATITNLENKISTILQKTIDVCLSWAAKLLQGQKKQDFRPRDEDLVSLGAETPTCLATTRFLDKVATQATATLSQPALGLFLSECALGLRSQLLDHFRRFTVSLTGGLVVSKDATKYAELVRGWPTSGSSSSDASGKRGSTDSNKRNAGSSGGGFEKNGMDILVEVANLFVIGPEALRERLRGVNGAEREALRSFVRNREDASSVGVQAVLAGL